MTTTNTAHDDDYQASRFAPQTWREARPPPELGSDSDKICSMGQLRGCSFCGSLAPDDLAAALAAGATLSPADRKYGWPHKFYVDGVPNPHAGLLETLGGGSTRRVDLPEGAQVIEDQGGDYVRFRVKPTPAPALTHAKFYTLHLRDATPEEKAAIERAIGLQFTFEDAGVRWKALGA